jgi:hypothetical protein
MSRVTRGARGADEEGTIDRLSAHAANPLLN